MKLHGQHFLLSYFKIQSVDPAGVRILDLPHDSPMLKQLSHRLFFKIAFKRRMRLFISKVNLERSAGQLLLTFCMRCRYCLYSRLSFRRFCLMQPLRRGVFHCEDSLLYLPTQIRFLIGGERVTCHWSKLHDALGQQQLELSTHTWSGRAPLKRRQICTPADVKQ